MVEGLEGRARGFDVVEGAHGAEVGVKERVDVAFAQQRIAEHAQFIDSKAGGGNGCCGRSCFGSPCGAGSHDQAE
jgi:hypothetical protein